MDILHIIYDIWSRRRKAGIACGVCEIRDDLMASTCKIVTILFGVSAGVPGLFPITLIPQNKIILKGRGQ